MEIDSGTSPEDFDPVITSDPADDAEVQATEKYHQNNTTLGFYLGIAGALVLLLLFL